MMRDGRTSTALQRGALLSDDVLIPGLNLNANIDENLSNVQS